MYYYKMVKYTAAQKKAYAKKMAKMRGKKKYKKNYKKRYNTSSMVISKPLLPQTQKVALRYTTRCTITPATIASDLTDAANNVALQTFIWNNMNDPDYTHGSTFVNSHADGALNHQPRMYDQYGAFYNKITCIGAKAKITFLARDRLINAPHTEPDPNNDDMGHSDTVTLTSQIIAPPKPCYVGYFKSTHADNASPSEKYDNLNEKKEIVQRMLIDPDKPVTMYAKWSLNKEPSRKYNLQLENAQMADDWGALFNQDLIVTQRRYLHLFAHPCSVQETGTVSGAVTPIDVAVEMEYICILSDRKEVQQS